MNEPDVTHAAAPVADLSTERTLRSARQVIPDDGREVRMLPRQRDATMVRAYALHRYNGRRVPEYVLRALRSHSVDPSDLEGRLDELYREL